MPNWCTGNLKVRGKYNDIKTFLKEELFQLGGNVLNREYKEPKIEEDEYGLNISTGKQGLWFKNAHRAYFDEDIEIYIDTKDDKEEEILTVNLGSLESAWSLDVDALTEISKKYNLDFKIYAYERGMQFNIDFEVHKGEVIKCNEIQFDDYIWECTNPNIGG